MLTIFDYLRHRARQSVIEGVREAVELLDSEKKSAPNAPLEPAATKPAALLFPEVSPAPNDKSTNKIIGNEKDSADDDASRPPRRGRPRRKQG